MGKSYENVFMGYMEKFMERVFISLLSSDDLEKASHWNEYVIVNSTSTENILTLVPIYNNHALLETRARI